MASVDFVWIAFVALMVVVLTWIGRKIISYNKFLKAIRKIPGRPTHWLLGNLHEFAFSEETLKFQLKWRYDNGYKLTKFWIGHFGVIVSIHHPDGVKKILKAPKAEGIYHLIEPWLGQGLLIANGDRWYRNRHLLTPAFHFDILKPYIYVYNEATDILLAKWEKSANEGKPVALYSSISKLTLDIILRCAFSYNSNCQERETNVYASAVRDLCDLSAARLISPVLNVSDFLYFYFTPQGWAYRKALHVVHEQAERIIKDRKKELGLNACEGFKHQQSDTFKTAKAAHKYLDFLDVLLTAKDEDGCGLTDLEIRYEVDTFMFEGHDTTANGLTWCLYLLAKHQEHQEKCREEIKNVLRGKSHFDFDDLSQLKYTQWCIKEAIRMYPPVYRVFRTLPEDTDICGYLLPKGTQVSIGIIDIHRNPNVWKNPMEFDPLRFHPDNFSERRPFEYIPFSAGPRNCIGQNFALNEELVTVGSILNKFSLHVGEGEEPKAVPIVLLRSEHEIFVYLRPLSDCKT